MWSRGLFPAAVTLAAVARAAVSADPSELTDKTFDKVVTSSSDPYMVLFYAPWCGHCKAIFPKWKKAAEATKGIVSLVKVDADKYGSLGGKYGVQGFPTIKLFGADKKSPKDFQGPREVDGLVQGAMGLATEVVNARLGKSGGGSSGGGGGGGGKSEVQELTDQTFQKKVLDSEDVWIVSFTAPWCGHCKRLEPEFARASAELKGKVKLGNLDATAHQATASKYGVQGYPTIKVFPGGKKSGDAEDYNGGRTASDIVTFGEEEFAKNAPAPEVLQAISATGWEANCTTKSTCFVGFLPLLQDSGKAGREEMIAAMQGNAEKFKRRPFGWTWVEATTQPELERLFDVGGFGYPALVAVNGKKKRMSTMKGQFSESGITQFVNKVVAGRGISTFDGQELPALVETAAWDGSDFVPEVIEEEFDLSDLDDVDLEDDNVKDEF